MIRAPLPTDQGYITSTWVRSLLSGMRGVGHAARKHGLMRTASRFPNEKDLRNHLGSQIDTVLDRPDTRGLVYVRDDDPNYIVGWVVYVHGPSVPIVHYAYVRDHDANGNTLRGLGIAGALFKRLGIERNRAVVCTSDGPSSQSMRGYYRASVHVSLAEFLK